MPKLNPNRNISRVDYDPEDRSGSHGYLLRFMRRGYTVESFFSDATHGGKRNALAEARKFRDQLEEAYPPYSRQELAELKSTRNTSGIVGVRYVEEVDKRWPSQPSYAYWVAQWSPAPYVQKTRRFSVDKYGYEKARQLAVKARKEGVKAME